MKRNETIIERTNNYNLFKRLEGNKSGVSKDFKPLDKRIKYIDNQLKKGKKNEVSINRI